VRYPAPALVLALCLVVGNHPARAQEAAPEVPLTACVASLPPSAFFPVVVYAYVHVDSGLPQTARFAAENFLQDVVDAAARLLGSTPGILPRGDSTLSWRELDGDLRVTASAGGRMTWVPQTDPDSPSGATRLLARAVSSAHEAGAVVQLPQDTAGNPMQSLTFQIRTVHPEVDHTGTAQPMRFEGTAAPIFSASVPWREGGYHLPRRGEPMIPDDASSAIAGGLHITVVTRYVVDTLGRAVPESIHDVWSARNPPPTGDTRHYWDEVAHAVHQWIRGDRYVPLRVGGCLVPRPEEYIVEAGYPIKQ
jgi:hypothetical protein